MKFGCWIRSCGLRVKVLPSKYLNRNTRPSTPKLSQELIQVKSVFLFLIKYRMIWHLLTLTLIDCQNFCPPTRNTCAAISSAKKLNLPLWTGPSPYTGSYTPCSVHRHGVGIVLSNLQAWDSEMLKFKLWATPFRPVSPSWWFRYVIMSRKRRPRQAPSICPSIWGLKIFKSLSEIWDLGKISDASAPKIMKLQ